MNRKIIPLGIGLLAVAILITASTNEAIAASIPETLGDLEVSFAGFETFITDLNGNVTKNTSDISTLQTQIDILKSIDHIEHMEMSVQATTTGAINPQSKEILFYGASLCKIEASGFVMLQFASNATVKHQNNCSANPGELISLDTTTDELFQKGDQLVLEKISGSWVEVFRDQT